jgi:transcriptional regulator with XRE-family HTH domain
VGTVGQRLDALAAFTSDLHLPNMENLSTMPTSSTSYTVGSIPTHCRGRPVDRCARAAIGKKLRQMYRSLGLSREDAGKLLQITPRTLQNWESGRVRVPYSAYKLLRVLLGYELPHKAWEGFTVRGNVLYTPEGYAVPAHEFTWRSLLVNRAQAFHQTAERCQRLIAEVARLKAQLQGLGPSAAGPWADAAAPGQRPESWACLSRNNVNAGGLATGTGSHNDAESASLQHQTPRTEHPPWPPTAPAFDCLTPSKPTPPATPMASESASTPSLPLPCGTTWTPALPALGGLCQALPSRLSMRYAWKLAHPHLAHQLHGWPPSSPQSLPGCARTSTSPAPSGGNSNASKALSGKPLKRSSRITPTQATKATTKGNQP